MSPPVAVTFDFWNTLVRATPGRFRRVRARRWRELLVAEGVQVEEEFLLDLFGRVVGVFEEHWAANRQFTAEDGAATALGWLAEATEVPPRLRDALVESFVRAGEDFEVEVAPDAGAVLAALADAGVPVGIVCDVGMTPSFILREYLTRHGLDRHVTHMSFSDEVGSYKPSPTIFRHALEGLGVADPAATVHVGDLRRTDVAGARGMGMLSVRYRAMVDDVPGEESPDPYPEAHHVVDDHRSVARLFGLEVVEVAG
ncbi:MAG: 2-haloalkanoic acid dehalogenase [Acidimicrobiales bacterium]|nr:MAG: 2-haloalkanoic acid dehalogenase [Acidimicrobiales bacterium]